MPWPTKGLYGITPRGIRVYLSKNTWFNHICANHPELRNCLDDILKAISEPEAIYLDRGTHISYRYSERRGKFIMLVYHIVGRVGKVKTAYAVMNPWIEVEKSIKVWPK
jgi:hypothetical protein